jgi:hypothetical protein
MHSRQQSRLDPSPFIVRTVIGFRHSIAGQPPKQAASCSVRSAIVVFPEIASFILIVYENAARLLLRPQQLRLLGDVGGDAAGFVAPRRNCGSTNPRLAIPLSKVENCGRYHIPAAHVGILCQSPVKRLPRPQQEEVMTGTGRKIATCLDETQVFRLFKCAVKDDDTLVDAIVERLYRKMNEFDRDRAEDTVELIVDRDAAAESIFRALLNDLWPDQRAQLAAS